MSDTPHFDFGKFVPGFDFLQSLAKGASSSMAQLPKLSNWVAPTIDAQELDKRIQELKAVQFWLEQNSRALAATIQALEVQKMTLATLKGMNFSIGDMANAFKPKTADRAGDAAPTQAGASQAKATPDAPAHPAEPAKAQSQAPGAAGRTFNAAGQPVVDPLQWWSALTSQFQQIAADALKDAAKGGFAAGLAQMPQGKRSTTNATPKPAAAKKAAGKKPAVKPVPRSAERKTPVRSTAARRHAG
ncbi:PhaM family polyhydroxyalkanoate granule multifunctional regulatory protein [Verminephrobacter eiseniae]|uniref:PhaM family polyhydroxyalkanoate granule multifunctional regulatory protein n=1 Tax=Verminephrobacter eiseniae TaxID=364317 RepID=UPI002238724D|nr:PhaM family polyhydroxyalkanoate granule multifunctional regulatory protein [Verminephrobacter eiseniae]MCW5238984.1 hypothetical protein [Verminephrobacter eiseniae]